MTYLSKGILMWAPTDKGITVSHCGKSHRLSQPMAELWLAGQYGTNTTQELRHLTNVSLLSELGIVSYTAQDDSAGIFRLLTNCAICVVRAKPRFAFLNSRERRVLRWLKRAGLRLTMAELVYLTEHNVKPVPAILGEENRQRLTEVIYTQKTIPDGILESITEKSPARDQAVQAVLGLLRKGKVFLV